jgi:hypothetical protein
MMKKKIVLLLTALFVFFNYSFSQDTIITNKVLRVNVINPGAEYEAPFFNQSTLSINLGIGYGGSHPNLTTYASGWLYLIAPFADIHYRNYYNLEERFNRGKSIQYNAGNFWGLRMLTRGKTLSSNFSRTSNYDFAVGPTWGLQRSFGKFNLLFDVGFVYYFDTKGNDGVVPTLELNIGYNFGL